MDLTFSIVLVSLLACCIGNEVVLFAGRKAELTAFPFQVSLQSNNTAAQVTFCAGAVIAPEWILTGAHCVNDRAGPIFINAGIILADQTSRKSQHAKVDRIFSHPEYSGRELQNHNNIALLKLKTALQFNRFVQAIDLPSKSYVPTGKGKVLGWGTTNEDSAVHSEYLIYTEALALSKEACQQSLTVNEKQFCVELTSGEHTCRANSGGPYMQVIDDTQVVVGIVSPATEFCSDQIYAYTLVSAYLDFITSTMSNN